MILSIGDYFLCIKCYIVFAPEYRCIALYINLQDIANSDMLWYKIARDLSKTIPKLNEFRKENATVEVANNDARQIVIQISEYLRSEDSYLLLLLDECDELVYRDSIRNNNQEQSGRAAEWANLSS